MEILDNIVRTIEYFPDNNWVGKKVSEYLKYRGYPERALTRLRHETDVLLLNGETIHMNHRLSMGDKLLVRITGDEDTDRIVPANIPVDIVYEDEDILVINKPSGMPVHPSINHYENTLANAVIGYMKRGMSYRCINRLDRDTTGLTIVAKHYLAAGILSMAMKQREIHREYTALVQGDIEDSEGCINAPIARKEASTVEREVREDGESAVTNYKVCEHLGDMALVQCRLETGRTHQIRVHMQYIGHPLLGDFLYNPDNHELDRQALHAGHLTFAHPISGKKLEFDVPLPEDMLGIIRSRIINSRWRCPCCGYYTLTEEPGSYDICKVCYWEDDLLQRRDEDLEGGANAVSLKQARSNYAKYGVCEERFINKVRGPYVYEIPPEAGEDNE